MSHFLHDVHVYTKSDPMLQQLADIAQPCCWKPSKCTVEGHQDLLHVFNTCFWTESNSHYTGITQHSLLAALKTYNGRSPECLALFQPSVPVDRFCLCLYRHKGVLQVWVLEAKDLHQQDALHISNSCF